MKYTRDSQSLKDWFYESYTGGQSYAEDGFEERLLEGWLQWKAGNRPGAFDIYHRIDVDARWGIAHDIVEYEWDKIQHLDCVRSEMDSLWRYLKQHPDVLGNEMTYCEHCNAIVEYYECEYDICEECGNVC